MNALTIYLWGIADQVRDLFEGLAWLFGPLLLVSLVVHFAMKLQEIDHITPYLKGMVWVHCILFFTSLAISILMPNSKTIAAMVIIPELANSDAVRRDLPELYDMAIKKLKDELSPTPEKQ